MEFAPGGDMLDYVKRKKGLAEDEARWFFQQLVIGLDYCHQMVLNFHFIKHHICLSCLVLGAAICQLVGVM